MIIRKLDQLGRIVIPKEMRKELEIEENNEIEIIGNENEILLRKHKREKQFKVKKVEDTAYSIDGKISFVANGETRMEITKESALEIVYSLFDWAGLDYKDLYKLEERVAKEGD